MEPTEPTPKSKDNDSPQKTINIQDLNNLIQCLKKREENIIQTVDLYSKTQSAENPRSLENLNQLIQQLYDSESQRIEYESSLLKKYIGFKTNDGRSKK